MTNQSHNYRIQVEQIILGACLLENAFVKVNHILSPLNFSLPDVNKQLVADHRAIYQAMQSHYPTKPIDVITIARHVKGSLPYLCWLSSQVASSANLRYHAFILLEICLRENFLNLLNQLHQQVKNNSLRIALYDINDEVLDYTNDILQVIEKASHYLKNFDDALVNNTIDDFNATLDKKAFNIKNDAATETLFNNLMMVNEKSINLHSRLAVYHLTDLIKQLTITKIDTKTLDRILSTTI